LLIKKFFLFQKNLLFCKTASILKNTPRQKLHFLIQTHILLLKYVNFCCVEVLITKNIKNGKY